MYVADNKQIKFYICQSCDQIVENVYQKGCCKNCLITSFQSLKNIINEAHASNRRINNVSK